MHKQVLIVEDDIDTRETLAELLRCEGYAVQCAANGREALKRLRAVEAPCLILLDLMMPVMDGWEFRSQQREDPELAPIPFVVMSGADEALRRAISQEAAGCLPKPLDFDDLLLVVRRHCLPS